MLTNTSDEPLGFLLVDAARLLRTRIDRAMEEAGLGLTAGEVRTLVYVDRYPASQQHALAAQMCVEPMTLVGYLDRLEARGLVSRERDPSDGRAKIVRATPGAKPHLGRAAAVARAIREEAMQDFQPVEVENMRSYLLRMRTNLTRDQHRTAAK